MNSTVVMTVIGRDQPGLVEAVSAVIEKHRGNWEESQMAHLAGQFAGILKVDLPNSALADFKKDLATLESQGLTVHVTEEGAAEDDSDQGSRVSLELVAHDQPGIVHRISQILATQGINVETFESHCESAPWSGERLFKAQVELRIPEDSAIESLRTELEKIADELMVDFSLRQAV